MADIPYSDPVSRYLDDLMGHMTSSDDAEEMTDTHRWNQLLQEAVAVRTAVRAIPASTLEPGRAPLVLTSVGVGSRWQKQVQLLELLGTLRRLPPGRLKAVVLDAAGLCSGCMQRG
mgnify:CR=1 FL=1